MKAPVVFMHGMSGFRQLGGYDYWYQVPQACAELGYDCRFLQVDPFQSVEVRAQEAATQIDEILAQTEAGKVHLVGHSQGGLDARWVVSKLGHGDRVATVTTIATPHHGSRVADVALGLIPGNAQAALDALYNLIIGTATGTQADLMQQVTELSTAYADNVFNPSVPNDPRVAYYSVGGITQANPFVNLNTTSVVDPFLLSAYDIETVVDGPQNDALVSVHSATWGQYWGSVPADHIAEIGWFPLTPHPSFDHLAFFKRLVTFLEGDGPAPL